MKRIAILILILTAGMATAQDGVSCLSLSHLHVSVCTATSGSDTIYTLVDVSDLGASSIVITRDQYLDELKTEREVTAKIQADLAATEKHFAVCSPKNYEKLKKKDRKKYVADNGCEELKW